MVSLHAQRWSHFIFRVSCISTALARNVTAQTSLRTKRSPTLLPLSLITKSEYGKNNSPQSISSLFIGTTMTLRQPQTKRIRPQRRLSISIFLRYRGRTTERLISKLIHLQIVWQWAQLTLRLLCIILTLRENSSITKIWVISMLGN